MTPRDESQAWVRSAEGDFEVIDGCMKSGVYPWNQLCFHAQQGAEKYLKALLVASSIAPPRTHNLAKLLELLLPLYASLASLMSQCLLLTPYAVAERYSPTCPEAAKAREVIDASYYVRAELRKLIT